MQACRGVPETGVADEATWRALLGPDLTPLSPDALDGLGATPADPAAGGAAQESSHVNSISSSGSGSASSEAAPDWGSLFELPVADNGSNSSNGSVVATDEQPAVARPNEVAEAAPAKPAPRDWPVLRRDDGGDHVHHLHVRSAVGNAPNGKARLAKVSTYHAAFVSRLGAWQMIDCPCMFLRCRPYTRLKPSRTDGLLLAVACPEL